MSQIQKCCLQRVWARFDPTRSGCLGLHRLRQFLAELREGSCPLASRGGGSAWERPLLYEAWHMHRPSQGMRFPDVLLMLLHAKLGRQVPSSAFECLADSSPIGSLRSTEACHAGTVKIFSPQ